MALLKGTRIFNNVRRCPVCGRKMVAFTAGEKSRLQKLIEKEGMCYTCAYWTDFIRYPPRDSEIIGNEVYRICPEADKSDKTLLLGGKGRRRWLLRYDGTLIRSNDVWKVGTIPVWFQPRLPPTACWIPESIYKQLSGNKSRCKAVGCFDRYHCYRYDYTIEFEDGPYNNVPLDWKVGDERCRFFVNLLKIPGYNNYCRAEDIIDESSVTLNKQNS